MRGSSIVVLVLVALALAVGASWLRAADGCQEKCNTWLAMCKKDCAEAPVPTECLKNCTPGYQACLTACAES